MKSPRASTLPEARCAATSAFVPSVQRRALSSGMRMEPVKDYLAGLQDRIVGTLEGIDGNLFRRDTWTRPEGGGGVSCLMEERRKCERGGVNLSQLTGHRLP